MGPDARGPSCATVDAGSANAASAWTRWRRVMRPRSYWSNNESTIEFIKITSRLGPQSLRTHRGHRVVHIDELISAHRQPDRRPRHRLGRHLVPRHRSGVEHIAFLGVELADSFE